MTFTRDGSPALEALLDQSCSAIGADLREIVPAHLLQALILGGDYGRGEGGVLATPQGDTPYNDLEFFILISGPPRLNERRFHHAIHALEQRHSATLGIDVEFKILSLASLQHSGPSMFFYDLVAGHRVITGPPDILASCSHLADASSIPLHEATRLLMNRCSGLLFAAARLQQPAFSSADADFTGRNIAKAQLAIGDALLTAHGRYHWSCLERHQRLLALSEPSLPIDAIRADHRAGTEFKLHPARSSASQSDLAALHASVSQSAWAVFSWLESRRLSAPFPSPLAYSSNKASKCPESSLLKNPLVRLRAFGPKGICSPLALRYPREGLLNSLPLLLWAPDLVPENLTFFSAQLAAPVSNWPSAVAAYQSLWSRFN